MKLHYPEGDTVEYEYDGSAMDDLISRVSRINMPQAPKTPSVAYEYIGMSMPALVDYESIDVQLDRRVAGDGSRDSGTYHAFDGFGRVKRHMWVDGNFDEGTGGNPNIPPIVEITHTYDNASNRLSRNNDNPTLAWPHAHATFEYDDLHRLISAEYVDDINDVDPAVERNDVWELDILGNWSESDAPVGDGHYPKDEREHNTANELLSRDITGWDSGNETGGGGGMGGMTQDDPTFYMTYDANGNLLTQEIPTASGPGGTSGHTPVNYYYDGWNRLVGVKYSIPGVPGGKPRVEFEYNGLNWRTVKRSDTAPSTPYLNQHRIMYYSAEWQLLEEHIDDSFDNQAGFVTDRRMQYVWGLRYIDDIVLRQQDSTANGTFDTRWYHCTDTLFSTVAVLSDSAALVERVSYDAYGMARHHHAADINGDGAVTQEDYDMVTQNLGNFGLGNITRNGTVNSRDQAWANDSLAALPRGEISKTDNIVGYAGYLFNAEIHGAGMYTVRHRHYAPDLGRWLTRDPIGYVDGMSLYEYVGGTPTGYLDPAGQERCSEFTSFVGLSGCSPRPPASFGLYAQACVELGVNNQLRHCEYDCCNSDVRERWILQADAHFKGSIKVTGGFQVYIKVGRLTVDGWLGVQGQGFAEGGVGGMGLSWALPCDGHTRVTEQRYCFPFSIGAQIDVGGRLSVHSTWFSWTVGVTGWARAEVDFTLCIVCSERCVPERIDFNSLRFSSGLQVCIGPGCINLPGPSGSW